VNNNDDSADLAPRPAAELARPAGLLDLVIAAWIDAKGERSGSAKTRTAYTDTLASFRSALQGGGFDLDGPLAAIALAAQGWAGQRAARGHPGRLAPGQVAPATFNQRLAILSSFYDYARRRGLVEGNPIDLVERRAVQEYGSAEALDPADARRRLAAIDRSNPIGLRDYALLSAALVTGRRLSEIVGWRWADVRIDGERVTITTRRAKGGKVMRDTLPPRAGRALLAWLSAYYGARLGDLPGNAPIWVNLSPAAPAGDPPLSRHGVDDLVRARMDVNPHSLRHTFARTMEDQGAKVSEIQGRLGHTSLQTTGRYLAALRSAENPHAERLDQLLLDE
jgi:integrase/recombinase XerC